MSKEILKIVIDIKIPKEELVIMVMIGDNQINAIKEQVGNSALSFWLRLVEEQDPEC